MNNEIPNCYYRIGIKALIKNEANKFLLIQEDNWLWELPWWWLDFGETPQEWIQRELQEEMWLTATSIAKNPSFFFTRKDRGIWRSNVVYETTVLHLNFTLSAECVAIRFFSIEEMLKEENTFPNVKIFAQFLQDQKTLSS